jgi:biopolymer transport protein ExbD
MLKSRSLNGWSPSQMAARRAARRRPSFYTAVNLWGFVSIMLVLLSMFIPDALNPHRYTWIPVDLPAARNAIPQPDASRDDVMRITVVRDGTVYLQKKRILREDLGIALREFAEMKVYLAVDKRAKNEDVEGVLDQIRLAGITSIVILAEKSMS